jgi:type II secretory pathway pseudopilin PulG
MNESNEQEKADRRLIPLRGRIFFRARFEHRRPKRATIARLAFTRIDLLVTIGVLLVAAVIALPAIGKHVRTSQLQRCQDNLRQVGQGWTQFASDHEEKFPWMLEVENGGTRNLTNAWQHFLVLSNYGMKATVSFCPADPGDKRRMEWLVSVPETGANPTFTTTYIVGLDAETRRPTTLLSGDYDLGGLVPNSGCRWNPFLINAALFRGVARTNGYSWTNRLHKKGEGNILLGDGSIRTGSAKILNAVVEQNEGYSSFLDHVLPPRLE